ncbi:putative phage protein [Vibrio chagasii]|nr:putative phage protein [Vibrio chagasii]
MEHFTYTNAILNRVKAKYALTSEYQLAKKLSISCGSLSSMRKGKRMLDWSTAFLCADLLEESDQNVVLGLLIDKSKKPRIIKALRESWPELKD